MKKRKTNMLLVLCIGVLAISGCADKGNVSKVERAVENEKSDENINDTKENADDISYKEIGEASARSLIEEKIGNEYKIELTGTYTDETAKKIDEKAENNEIKYQYYLFSVSKENEPLVKELAVNKLSGEVFSYDVENKIQDYSQFPLYDENKDKKIKWEGRFLNDKNIIEILPIDNNSFEFHITDADSKKEILVLAAFAQQNKAECKDNDYTIYFELNDNKLTVSEDDKSKFEISGEYLKE